MPEYVLGVLDAAEQTEVRAHLGSDCPHCCGALAEAQASVATVGMALPPIDPPAALRQRLLSRLGRQEQDLVSISPRRRHPVFSRLAVAASLALAATAGVLLWSTHQSTSREIQRLKSSLAQRDSSIQELQSLVASEQVKLVQLTADPQGHASGRVFWDRERGTWHIYVFNLAPPGPDKTYEVWFITAKGVKIPAGTFDVARDGSGALKVSVPRNIGEIVVAAITDEPAGGSQQPTGTIHLKGAVQ